MAEHLNDQGLYETLRDAWAPRRLPWARRNTLERQSRLIGLRRSLPDGSCAGKTSGRS